MKSLFTPLKKSRIEIYTINTFPLQYRWRITSTNGEIIGASTESFTTELICKTNLNLVYKALKVYYNE